MAYADLTGPERRQLVHLCERIQRSAHRAESTEGRAQPQLVPYKGEYVDADVLIAALSDIVGANVGEEQAIVSNDQIITVVTEVEPGEPKAYRLVVQDGVVVDIVVHSLAS